MSVVSVGDPGVYGRYGFVQLSLIVPATIGQAVQQLERTGRGSFVVRGART